MSNENDKFLNSKRRHKTDVAVAKQLKIAKSHGVNDSKIINEPHRLAKHHALNCGNPKCYLCGNPRRTHKDTLTQQEKRLFQSDEPRDKHSNGLSDPTDIE